MGRQGEDDSISRKSSYNAAATSQSESPSAKRPLSWSQSTPMNSMYTYEFNARAQLKHYIMSKEHFETSIGEFPDWVKIRSPQRDRASAVKPSNMEVSSQSDADDGVTRRRISEWLLSSLRPSNLELSSLLGLTHANKNVSRPSRFKRKAVQVLMDGNINYAQPDSGSEADLISEAFARESGVHIDRTSRQVFRMGNGKEVRSIGKAYMKCRLLGDANEEEENRVFHVLERCIAPIILGMGFLEKCKLYTSKLHMLIESPFKFGNMLSLKYLGSTVANIPFTADGRQLHAVADTGSEADFMSVECALQHGFDIDSSMDARSMIQLADGSVVNTIGKVHVSNMQIGPSKGFDTDFHVLPGLPCDVILGEELLEQLDAFNTCAEIQDSNDRAFYGMYILINLGPLQKAVGRLVKLFRGSNTQQQPERTFHAEEHNWFRENQTSRFSQIATYQTVDSNIRTQPDSRGGTTDQSQPPDNGVHGSSLDSELPPDRRNDFSSTEA